MSTYRLVLSSEVHAVFSAFIFEKHLMSNSEPQFQLSSITTVISSHPLSIPPILIRVVDLILIQVASPYKGTYRDRQ